MRTSIQVLVAAAMLGSASLALAESGISTEEEHVLRGFFDRQSPVIAATKLALEKGSTDAVKKYAQSELDMYQKVGTDVAGLYTKFQLVTTPNPNLEYRPLEEGKSRGVSTLTNGQTYSTTGILETLKRPLAQAAAPAQPVQQIDTSKCKSPTVPGCGPTIAPGIDLNALAGKEFDNAYLLLTVYGHDAMMRHSTDELLFDKRNADMEAFAKNTIKLLSKQSSTADGLYRGTARAEGGAAGGMSAGMGAGAPAGAAPGGKKPE
ncbi:MAG: hypothetical protein QM808_03775 [Steroidobacteraceae bacterium]